MTHTTRPATLPWWILLLTCAVNADLAVADHHESTDQAIPTPLEVLKPTEIDKVVPHHPGGEWPKDWVKTPLGPRVIRKGEDAATATYQECTGYTFLINSMKRPRTIRLRTGRIVLVATAWLHKTGDEVPILLTSDDEGQSWSQPREAGIHGELVDLGSGQVGCVSGGNFYFSPDGGDTWEKRASLTLPNGKPGYAHGTVVFDGKRIGAMFYYESAPHGPVAWTAYTVLRFSSDLGHTWSDPAQLPGDWYTSEGALAIARDGALVAALRTGPKRSTLDALTGATDAMIGYNDHWRRITTARTMDDGKTWTDHQVHFRWGKTHNEMITLPNGDILLTYAARIGELDGRAYHGIEAVLSHDNGKTWDWPNRYYLFRWDMMAAMHSPQSVRLCDGRIMTVFLYHYDAPWGKRLVPAALNIGMVDAIFWRP